MIDEILELRHLDKTLPLSDKVAERVVEDGYNKIANEYLDKYEIDRDEIHYQKITTATSIFRLDNMEFTLGDVIGKALVIKPLETVKESSEDLLPLEDDCISDNIFMKDVDKETAIGVIESAESGRLVMIGFKPEEHMVRGESTRTRMELILKNDALFVSSPCELFGDGGLVKNYQMFTPNEAMRTNHIVKETVIESSKRILVMCMDNYYSDMYHTTLIKKLRENGDSV